MTARMTIGSVPVDRVTFDGALTAIADLVEGGQGGYVFTPNTDHVVLAGSDPELAAAYAGANLSVADGMPLVWASRLLGAPVPAKVSGSDLVTPLLARAATRRWPVYLLGGGPGVAERAVDALRPRLPDLEVVGIDAPRIGDEGDPTAALAAARARASGARLILVALGTPKQERWIHRFAPALAPAVLVGVGASFDFLAGVARRAPAWVSRIGLEWLYRLLHEPKRLWRRYLVRDPAFLRIVWRQRRRRALPPPRPRLEER